MLTKLRGNWFHLRHMTLLNFQYKIIIRLKSIGKFLQRKNMVPSTLMSWSNENKSCIQELASESSHESSSILMSWSNGNKSCMRVDKRDSTWEFHQLPCSGPTRTRVAWELASESLHGIFINSHVLVQREQELHEIRQVRVYMRVSSTLMSWSNEKKSCMRVDKREFIWEFHQPLCPGQTRARVAWEFQCLTSRSVRPLAW